MIRTKLLLILTAIAAHTATAQEITTGPMETSTHTTVTTTAQSAPVQQTPALPAPTLPAPAQPTPQDPASSATKPLSDTPTSVTLPKGVVYQILKQGTGPEAGTTNTRLIHYTLYLENGSKLESSRDAIFPLPFNFTPGKNESIKGMETGTNGMHVGEIRKIYVPADMGYGDKPHGNVPPNSALIFNVELVGLKDPSATNKLDLNRENDPM